MPYGRPTDTDSKVWYCIAQRIDQARLANEAFQSSQHLVSSIPSRIPAPYLAPLTMVHTLLVTPSLTLPRLLPLSLSLRVSMDIDAAQKARPLSPYNCYHCRETGHLVKGCPHCLDIQ